MRYFKDKGYAFVRYDNKESACNAIVALHLTEVAIKKNLKLIPCETLSPGWGAGCEVQVKCLIVKSQFSLDLPAGARREEEASRLTTRTMEVEVAEATTAIRSVCWLKSNGFWLVLSQVTGLPSSCM